MTTALYGVGTIFKKRDRSNHKPDSNKNYAGGTCQHTRDDHGENQQAKLRESGGGVRLPNSDRRAQQGHLFEHVPSACKTCVREQDTRAGRRRSDGVTEFLAVTAVIMFRWGRPSGAFAVFVFPRGRTAIRTAHADAQTRRPQLEWPEGRVLTTRRVLVYAWIGRRWAPLLVTFVARPALDNHTAGALTTAAALLLMARPFAGFRQARGNKRIPGTFNFPCAVAFGTSPAEDRVVVTHWRYPLMALRLLGCSELD